MVEFSELRIAAVGGLTVGLVVLVKLQQEVPDHEVAYGDVVVSVRGSCGQDRVVTVWDLTCGWHQVVTA